MLDPHDLVEAYNGRVGLLSRCILYGLVEPNVEVNVDIQRILASSLIEELVETKKNEPVRLLTRMERAVKWATRSDIPHELGLYLGISALQLLGRNKMVTFKRTDIYQQFKTKFGDIIEEFI
jgi:hypothetical protein